MLCANNYGTPNTRVSVILNATTHMGTLISRVLSLNGFSTVLSDRSMYRNTAYLRMKYLQNNGVCPTSMLYIPTDSYNDYELMFRISRYMFGDISNVINIVNPHSLERYSQSEINPIIHNVNNDCKILNVTSLDSVCPTRHHKLISNLCNT